MSCNLDLKEEKLRAQVCIGQTGFTTTIRHTTAVEICLSQHHRGIITGPPDTPSKISTILGSGEGVTAVSTISRTAGAC